MLLAGTAAVRVDGWLVTGRKRVSAESAARREEGLGLGPPLLRERRGGRSCLGDVKERKRRAIPPTKIVVERFWGLGCSQETVVAPSQASHRAALGHPVTDRQTYQMAWPGQTDRDLFIFLILWRQWWGGLFSTSCLLGL